MYICLFFNLNVFLLVSVLGSLLVELKSKARFCLFVFPLSLSLKNKEAEA